MAQIVYKHKPIGISPYHQKDMVMKADYDTGRITVLTGVQTRDGVRYEVQDRPMRTIEKAYHNGTVIPASDFERALTRTLTALKG